MKVPEHVSNADRNTHHLAAADGYRRIEQGVDAWIDRTEGGLLRHHKAVRADRYQSAGAQRLHGDQNLEFVTEGPYEIDNPPRGKCLSAVGMQDERDSLGATDVVQKVAEQVDAIRCNRCLQTRAVA